MLHLLDEEGGRAGGKPVVVQPAVQEAVQQTERVIDFRGFSGEMVTVVALLEFIVHLLGRNLQDGGHTLHIGPKGGAQLLLGKAADGRELLLQRDIRQVVDGGEDAQLRELCNAGDEAELDILFISFERYIELLHDLAHGIECLLVVKHVEQGRVVLVDNDRHLPPRLLIKPPD